MRYCYQRALDDNPKAAGAGQLVLRVVDGGEVEAASFTSDDDFPASLGACVSARARASQFDQPQAGPATITVPIKFMLVTRTEPAPPSP
jgi:hypothetical protein